MKIKVMLPKGLHLTEFKTPYITSVPIVSGDTYDSAIIEDQETVEKIINDQSMVYEVVQ